MGPYNLAAFCLISNLYILLLNDEHSVMVAGSARAVETAAGVGTRDGVSADAAGGPGGAGGPHDRSVPFRVPVGRRTNGRVEKTTRPTKRRRQSQSRHAARLPRQPALLCRGITYGCAT